MFVQFTRLNGGKIAVNPLTVKFVANVSAVDALKAEAHCEIVFADNLSVIVQEDRHSVETQLGQAVLSFASICGGN